MYILITLVTLQYFLENRGNHTFSEPQMGKYMLQLDVTTWANVSDKKREAGCLVSMALDCSKTSLYPLLRRWGRGVLISSLRIFHFGLRARGLSSSYSSEFTVYYHHWSAKFSLSLCLSLIYVPLKSNPHSLLFSS